MDRNLSITKIDVKPLAVQVNQLDKQKKDLGKAKLFQLLLAKDFVENHTDENLATSELVKIIPEFSDCIGVDQKNSHHQHTISQHLVKTVGNVDDRVSKVIMLLHDISKPECQKSNGDGTSNFNGHDVKSAEKTEQILKRLNFDEKESKQIITLINKHDFRFDKNNTIHKENIKTSEDQKKFNNNKKRVSNLLDELEEAFGKGNSAEGFEKLMNVQTADVKAQNETDDKLVGIEYTKNIYNEVIKDKEAEKNKVVLVINGGDLGMLGFKGKEIGDTLKKLTEMVSAKQIENISDELLNAAKRLK